LILSVVRKNKDSKLNVFVEGKDEI